MARKIQVKRGNQSDLPTLAVGELGFTVDENRTYIGSQSGNVELATVSQLTDIAISVKSFGAIGNGTTDDRNAIQSAIDYAASIGSNVSLVPKKTYLISSRLILPSNITLIGNGSVLKLKDNAQQANSPDLVLIKDVSNIKISNVEFDGNNENQPQQDANVYRGILIQNAENVTVENCYFHDIQHQAIQVAGQTLQNPATKGVHKIRVAGNRFKNVWCALQVTESDSRDVSFVNNDVENCWEHGFTTYPGVSFVVVKGNIIKNVGLREEPTYSTFVAGCGIRIFETHNAVVEGNIIINPHFCGIRLTTNSPTTFQAVNRSVVANNIIMGGARNGSTGSGILIGEQGKSSNVIVSNNIVENFTAYNYADGIKVMGDHAIVQGNRIKDIKQSGILVAGNYCVVSENSLTDVGLYGIMFGGTIASDNCVATGNNIQSLNQETPIQRGIYAQSNGTNVKLANNNLVGVTTHYFNAAATPLFINGVFSATTVPSAGTFMRGDRVVKLDPTVGAPKAWTCTGSGTMGTLNGGATTGNITSGSNVLTVSATTGLMIGQYISIAGVTGTKRIMRLSGTTVTLDSNADATVAGVAVVFANATFVSEGNL